MNLKIAVLGGDGIGPEITQQSVKVLKAVADRFDHQFQFEEALVGAAAIDLMGNPLPEATLDLCKNSDAVLFGAIGDPKYDNDPEAKVRPEQGLLLSLIHISEPTRRTPISYAVFCLKK